MKEYVWPDGAERAASIVIWLRLSGRSGLSKAVNPSDMQDRDIFGYYVTRGGCVSVFCSPREIIQRDVNMFIL